MTRKRDLSGFGGGTPGPAKPAPSRPLAPPVPETPIVPPPEVKTRGKAKQRITLSLPTAVAGMLRSTAERENRIYLDIILQAFVDHSTDIDDSFVERRRTGEPTTKGGRRRADSGRTQIPLNILGEDLRELDRKAAALSLDRSAYVTELLVRSLNR